jgi:hypothetical protein
MPSAAVKKVVIKAKALSTRADGTNAYEKIPGTFGGAQAGSGTHSGPGPKKLEILAYIQSKNWKTPLEYLLTVMNDDDVPRDSRVEAAKAAAPFVHAKLQAIVIENPNDALDAEIKAEYRDALRAMKEGGAPPPQPPL